VVYRTGMEPVRWLDAAGLKALAHPLRVRMLGTLRSDGPATATQLAKRLGENTGTTSWHLRQLADAGFIEEDPERGSKRDRWWRARTRSTQLAVRDFADQPELLGVIGLYLQGVVENQFSRAADFVGHADDWPPAWQDAANFSDFALTLDPAGVTALTEELFEVIRRYQAAEPAPGAEPVSVQLQAFPRRGGRP
jgi:DNA-binding transcriptional ArsR family regulator